MDKELELNDIIKMIEILKFDKKSRIDLTLLIEDFVKKIENYSIDEKLYKDGNFLANKNLSKYVIYLRQYGELDSNIKRYLKNFNLEEFVLRKVDYYGTFNYDKLGKLFCEAQQIELDKLHDEGYISIKWTDDVPNDYQEVRLSKKGLIKLFKIDNAKEVEEFILKLKTLRYNMENSPSGNLLDDYLEQQNLDTPEWEILKASNIDAYCQKFDLHNLLPNVRKIDYVELDNNEKSEKLIEDMLTIFNGRQSIYLTHPNYIFSNPNLITDDVKDIENIDWKDIDISKMLKIGDFKKFVLTSYDEIFKYISDNMLEKKNFSHLAILEKSCFNDIYEPEYLIRGIIKLEDEKFFLAFNPKYQKSISYNENPGELDNNPKFYIKK